MDMSASPGRYTVCYTTWGQEGELKPQDTVSLLVIGHATSSSISAVTPTRVAPGVQTLFKMHAPQGVYSNSSYVTFSRSGACSEAKNDAIAMPDSNFVTTTVKGEGEWVICYSTSGPHGPFVQQGLEVDGGHGGWGPRILGITRANASIISIHPKRITVGLLTEVVVIGAMPSEIHSYIAFSQPSNCSNPVEIFPLLSNTVAIKISSSTLSELCYSTSGSGGPYFAQSSSSGFLVQFVLHPNSTSIQTVRPPRFAAADSKTRPWKSAPYSVLLEFVGADFSSRVFVGLTRSNNCSAAGDSLQYMTSLKTGTGHQAAPVQFSVDHPSTYRVCYSVTGNTSESVWVLQEAKVVVVPAARTGLVTSLKVCEVGTENPYCIEESEMRLPSNVQYSFQFLGLDFSTDTRVSFSRALHQFYGRPDCSSNEERYNDVPVSSGSGNQSGSMLISTPSDVGRWHVCVSTQSGKSGSFWPRGEAISANVQYVFMHVFESASATSITGITPVGTERGKEVEMAFEGLQVSPLTRVGFALSGACNSVDGLHSLRVVDTSARVKFVAPNWTSTDTTKVEEIYKICYKQVGQQEYSEQRLVDFVSMAAGGTRAVEYLRLQYLTTPIDSREHNDTLTVSIGNAVHLLVFGMEFSNTGWVGLSPEGSAGCTDVQILAKIPTPEDLPLRNLVVQKSGTYAICYSTTVNSASPVWIKQGVHVKVIEKTNATSIRAVKCIGGPDRCLARCSLTVRAQAGVMLKLVGASYKPSVKVAFTSTGNCEQRLWETPIAPDLTVDFVGTQPGIFQLCYSSGDPAPTTIPTTDSESWDGGWGECTTYAVGEINNHFCLEDKDACSACPVACSNLCEFVTQYVRDESWQLQTTAGVQVTVETVWDDAALLPVEAAVRIQPAAGNQAVSVVGSGFDPKEKYQCNLFVSVNSGRQPRGSTAAVVMSADRVVCKMPSLSESSTLAFFSLRLRTGEEIHHKEPESYRNRMLVVPQVVHTSPACGDKVGGGLITIHGFGFGGPSNWSRYAGEQLSNVSVIRENSCVSRCLRSQLCANLSDYCDSVCSANSTSHTELAGSNRTRCIESVNCNGHGRCIDSTYNLVGISVNTTQTCVCNEGWSGNTCALPTTFQAATKYPLQTISCTSNATAFPVIRLLCVLYLKSDVTAALLPVFAEFVCVSASAKSDMNGKIGVSSGLLGAATAVEPHNYHRNCQHRLFCAFRVRGTSPGRWNRFGHELFDRGR